MNRGYRRLFGASAFAILVLASSSTAWTQTAPPSSDKAAPKAVEAAGYVFVSGQGPRRADGTIPGTFADQIRQAFENVKSALESAGLTADHLVYMQVYLEDVQRVRELDELFAGYFANDPPARAVLGVAKAPEQPIQINAIAVRDLEGKQAVSVPGLRPNKAFSAGMLTHDQLFISTMPGRDAATGTVPQDPYLTAQIPTRVMNEQYAKRFEFGNTPGRATIEVSSLPDGTHIAYTGIAVRDLSRRLAIRPKNMPPSPTASPCVFAGDILYCSAKSGFIPGLNGGVYVASTADQTRQTMRNLLDNLEEAGMSFDQVVSTVIYLDDLGDIPSFVKVYKKYFSDRLPAQTIVQQLPPGNRNADEEGHYPTLEQVSLVAVRGTGNPKK
jgi:enamine deaminase RidA (YjgF/YER057c/UK114 family)